MSLTLMEALAPEHYWHQTDKRIALETHADKAAASELNAEWLLVNCMPFGTPKRVLP